MSLHHSTFGVLQPSERQTKDMARLRQAAKDYADVIEDSLPPGADKTYVLRKLREIAMWANVAVTREADGTPR